MKIKFKITGIFIISIAISFVVFFLTTAYLIEHVAWDGIDNQMLQAAASEVEDRIEKIAEPMEGQLQSVINEVAGTYDGMIVEILAKDGSWCLTTATTQRITTTEELVLQLSKKGEYQQEKWTIAKEMTLKNGESFYIVAIAPREYYRLLSWNINGQAGIRMIRTILIVGFSITLTVSTLFALLFSKSMLRRFNRLYYAMAQFGLGNTAVVVRDIQKDEISDLVHHFNEMADKIRGQVEAQKEEERKRRELVANISHDLRTPLASIVGYTESLRDGVYDGEEEQRKYFDIIYKKALYTEKVLATLLDFSRLECGNLVIHKEQVDLAELTREVLIEYLPIMEAHQIELLVQIGEGQMNVWLDKHHISRVIRNLMDNAIKYGSDGKEIKVTIKKNGDQLTLEVADRGQGIAKEELEHIFKRFYRVDKSRNTKSGGMGLGLAIVDEIVKKHGGTVEATSEIGKGTKVKVRLY